METPVTKTGTTNGAVELENRLKYYEVSLQTLFRRYWSRLERRKGRGELLSPVPQSTAACQATKDVSTEAGTQGGFCSHKLPINVGKGLLLPPALSPRKSGVRTKLGVTTASADNRTGMRSHPASPSANYTGATDCGFQLGAHLLIAKGRGDSRTDLTDMSVQQRDAPSLIVQSEEQRAVCVLMNISCRVLKFRCSVMYLSLTSLFSNIFIPVSPSWILLKHLIYSY